MPELNDKLLQRLTEQRDRLTHHIEVIDELLTYYLPIKEHAQATRTHKRSPKRKKVKNTGGRANKKTDQEIAAMGKMFSNGVPIRDISKKLGVSDVTVYKYAKLNKWKRGEE